MAIALAWSGAAAAQSVSGAQIAGQCTAEGAFGQRFGAETVNGAAGMALMNSQMVDLPASFAPFVDAEVVFTVRSRRIHTVTGMARFASDSEAKAAFDAAVAAMEADTRFATHMTEYEDSMVFYTTDQDAMTGLKADISVNGREIVYFCTDLALYTRTMDELAGRDITASTARPTPPQITLPDVPANVCSTAEGRTAFLAGFEPKLQEIMGYGGTIHRYNETLMHWANAQMIAQGLWTQDESASFALQLLNDPQFMRHTETSMNAAMEMLGAVMAYSEATDDATRCTRAHQALTSAHTTISSAQTQWGVMGRLYQAEAERRGGTLALD
jgi:hypothetical protein